MTLTACVLLTVGSVIFLIGAGSEREVMGG
jgi:hypothetical protein